MVPTVRRASLTAREATSVERCAWPAISPIEAASSSTEEAAAVTLPEATPTRSLGGAGLGGDGVGGAVELGGGDLQPLGGLAHARQRLVDRHLEAGDGGGDDLAAVLALAVGGGLALRQPLALEHGVAEHDDGARHGAELVLGLGGGDARGGVAGGEPRHRLRQAVERPRDAAPDQPAERQTDQHRAAADQGSMIQRVCDLRLARAPRWRRWCGPAPSRGSHAPAE